MKTAILLRSLRGVLGMTQLEFAHWVDVPRVTITRAESLRLPIKAPVFFKIVDMAKEKGIEVDIMSENPTFKISKKYIDSEIAAALHMALLHNS
jgi:predicted transcriptional regulator